MGYTVKYSWRLLSFVCLCFCSLQFCTSELPLSDSSIPPEAPFQEDTCSEDEPTLNAELPPQESHGQLLYDCLITRKFSSQCTMEELPLLGLTLEENKYAPDIEQIMDRVSAAKPWMKNNFRAVLEYDKSFALYLVLFNPVAGIMIDDTARHPFYGSKRSSFYSSATAGIYIDAVYLWLTLEQRNSISNVSDHRIALSKLFDFVPAFRYVVPCKNGKDLACTHKNRYLYQSNNLVTNTERSVEEIAAKMWRLLFHELAHANDYIPPAELVSKRIQKKPLNIDSNDTPRDIRNRFYSSVRISHLLYDPEEFNDPYILDSEELLALAQTLYKGQASTAEMKQYDGTKLGSWFAAEGATHQYSYTTVREDVAQLFQDAMMYFAYGAVSDFAYLKKPADTVANTLLNYANFKYAYHKQVINITMPCDFYTVQWGARARIGSLQVKDRAKFVAKTIFPLHSELMAESIPYASWSSLFNDMALSMQRKELETGIGWCTALGPPAQP